MKFKSIFIVGCISVFSLQALAQESMIQPYKHPFKLPENKHAYIFTDTVIFGHSISSNLMYDIQYGVSAVSMLPVVGPLIGSTFDFFAGGKFAPSPGQVIVESANSPNKKITNIAKGYGSVTIDKRLDKIFSHSGVGFEPEDLGLGKIQAFQGKFIVDKQESAGRMMHVYALSKVLIGIDAFYMGALLNECSYYRDSTEIIKNFIQKTALQGKVMILGNVPDERFDKMNDLAQSVIAQVVDPDWKSCMKEINFALKLNCTPENLCYLIDMHSIVEEISRNDGAVIQGKKYSYKALRPDGANLSPAGVQLIIEKIIKALDENPPLQSKDKSILRK